VESPDPESRAGVARAHFRLAQVRRLLGEFDNAQRSMHRAADLFASLANDSTARPEFRHQALTAQVEVLLDRAVHAHRVPGQGDPRALLRQALRLLETLPADYQAQERVTVQAGVHLHLAQNARNSEPARVEGDYRQALTWYSRLESRFPHSPAWRPGKARALQGLGVISLGRNQPLESERYLRAALDCMAGGSDASIETVSFLTRGYNNLGIHLMDQWGRPAEAEKEFQTALKYGDRWVRLLPGSPTPLLNLGGAYCNLALSLGKRNRYEEALPHLDRAAEYLRPVLRLGNSPIARRFLRNSLWTRALYRENSQQQAGAARDWRDLIVLVEPAEVPGVRTSQALAHARAGEHTSAAAVLTLLRGTHPTQPRAAYQLAIQWASLADSPLVPASARDAYLGFAVALLESAAAGGVFVDPLEADRLDAEPALQILADRPAFRRLQSLVRQRMKDEG
jgi:tetratricopeptide (TPR) repeat protein